jgi:hypothetical protein
MRPGRLDRRLLEPVLGSAPLGWGRHVREMFRVHDGLAAFGVSSRHALLAG